MFFIIIIFFNVCLLFNCNARCNVSINIKIDFSKMYKLNHIKRKVYFLLKKKKCNYSVVYSRMEFIEKVMYLFLMPSEHT